MLSKSLLTALHITLALAVALVSWLASLPLTVFNFPTSLRAPIVSVLPQGWNFFTKSPRDQNIRVFERPANAPWREVPEMRVQLASAPNLYGVARRTRAVAIEAGLIMSRAAQFASHACTKDPQRCLAEVSSRNMVSNPTSEPRLCGDIAIFEQRQLPWAWSGFRDVSMPSMLKVVQVRC